MKDGIISGTGSSRYLKSVPALLDLYPTYADFAQALVEGTLPIDLNGINPDGWSQLGDGLNKANLLKDTTAALYGLSETAVPDDVLVRINDRIADGDLHVGDILTTIRPDPGEEWALCNGDFVSRADYPDLWEFTPQRFGRKSIDDDTSVTNVSFYDAAVYDGMWVLIGTATVDGISYCPVIYYTTDPAGEWTRKVISTESTYLTGIACHNGLWVCCGYTQSTTMPRFYYATDPGGEWTAKIPDSSGMKLQDIDCYDGTWVAVGYNPTGTVNRAYFLTTTDPSGEWTVQAKSTSTETLCVTCYNGLWVAGGSNRIFYTEDPTSSWTSKDLTFSSGNTHALRDIACHDGVWVAGVNGGYVLTTTDVTGTWKEVEVNSDSVSFNVTFRVIYLDGKWVLFGRIFINKSGMGYANGNLWATDPTGEWTFETSGVYDSAEAMMYAAATDGVDFVAGAYATNALPSYVATSAGANLPVVSTDNAYCYIKVKE